MGIATLLPDPCFVLERLFVTNSAAIAVSRPATSALPRRWWATAMHMGNSTQTIVATPSD
jgi:hypothetical protein